MDEFDVEDECRRVWANAYKQGQEDLLNEMMADLIEYGIDCDFSKRQNLLLHEWATEKGIILKGNAT